MYKNKILNVKIELTEVDLSKVEKTLKTTLPESLRKHYLNYNGGSLEKYLFQKGDQEYILHEFLEMKDGEFEESFIQFKIEEQLLPADLIPFAIDPGGDFFCMSNHVDKEGAIYLWQGEYDDPERAFTYLSPSLQNFIDQMIEE